MLNVGLLKHPLNWLTVWLMLFIAALAGAYVSKLFTVKGTSNDGSSES